MSHIYEAKELMRSYPQETQGLSLLEVERIWEDYSDTMAAGWMSPNQETVEMVFSHYTR